jgi:hypothetical protein
MTVLPSLRTHNIVVPCQLVASPARALLQICGTVARRNKEDPDRIISLFGSIVLFWVFKK